MMTLVIWEQVPEQTDLYLIPNSEIDEEMRGILQRAHNKLINADEDVEDALKLNAALSDTKYDVEEQYKPYHGRFAHHKVDKDTGPVIDTAVTHVYLSGWYL